MKTNAVLASLLFGSFAVAAPVDRRALVYHTEIVTETVVIYTTVYDDEPMAQTTTSVQGLFYEQPKQSTTSAVVEASSAVPSSLAVPSSSAAPAYTPPASVEQSSSVYTPPPQTPTPTPTPTPAPATEAPKPTTTAAPYVAPAPAPAPVVSSVAPVVAAPSPSPAAAYGGGSTDVAQFTNVDITIYDNNGGFGACGTELHDSDYIVALAKDAWGSSTYDVMTGAATNPWCGQMIDIEYKGNHVKAKIMDLCPGCSGNDIDLSLATWKALTGLDEKTRLKANWSKMG
ncbi:hypothetical protein EJ02DRAFT_351621 [Clathrospora elynae]|uniref:RlpA-like protein double-psi beta-barrel domain-containing protein n=1 Tax=Clathrospora elynae TaxID=706981 RepID=A0A6A5SJB2_9PLEO|nr:hypothetical protein EJ02DRAFT_351621 [Clathrospora elynae]